MRAPSPTGLRRFDTAGRVELDALPPAVRSAVIADRHQRVTAALRRFVAAGGRVMIGPRS